MKTGQKHLIECCCSLPKFQSSKEVVYHRFVVFSELENDVVIPKHAQCNNCGVIHRVFDIGKSEIILGKDKSSLTMSLFDIKASLPNNITNLLDSYKVDLSTYEEALSILENERWGSFIVLQSNLENGNVEGKLLRFNSKDVFKVEPFSMVTEL
jgi:hypothetical protein